MDPIGEIILKLKITELEAQLALREIERAGLSWKIDDTNTDVDERYRATIRRDRVLIEWAVIMSDLQELRDRQREFDVTPRAVLN